MTFNFDKNKGMTLYNFTKQENTEAKSCCNFRIESDNGKRYTLSIKRQRRLVRGHRVPFCYPAGQSGSGDKTKREKGNAQ